MKINCDVCDKGEASVFCVADEAALCSACDHRVHHANKLAGKHHRFSLLLPSPKQHPVCDICQERRAYVFCQQDRAILCTECDIPIHKANEHTKKHNRFLLTGIKLSSTSALYSSSSSPETVIDLAEIQKSPKSSSVTTNCSNKEFTAYPESKNQKEGSNGNSQLMLNGTTSSICGQFGDVQLPDWHVEDFLDHSFSPLVFSKSCSSDGDGMPFWDSPDLACNNENNTFSPNNNVDWVPQASAVGAGTTISPIEIQPITNWNMGMVAFGGQINFKQQKNKDMLSFKSNKKWVDDNSFAVPQTNTTPNNSSASSAAFNKRFRAF